MNQPAHRFKAELFKALGHPLRMKIIEILDTNEISVADLLEKLEVRGGDGVAAARRAPQPRPRRKPSGGQHRLLPGARRARP